jgi:O-antigen/teichoic acid export membrane protein
VTHGTLPRRRRLRSLASSHASGALVAQVWQATASFGMQVAAAHLLGARGLGELALCLGVIILTTAVTSGFVGDALTVLDRHDRGIRAGLQWWAGGLTLVGPGVAGVALWALGVLEPAEAGWFVVAAALFQAEEVARRLLMATLRFWRLVLVDSVALVVVMVALVVLSLVDAVTLGTFFVAIAAGQLAGLVVAVALAPGAERRLVSLRGARIREVAAFGGWRGAQVSVNPGVFTAMRVLVVTVAGAAALGQVEAARIYVAPALLAVQGIGSYLLASYARDRSLPLRALVSRASRSALVLAGGALALGVVLYAAAPLVGPWVTGDSFTLPAVTVLGWAVYAAATATLQPYVSLAAARGRQRAALAVRLTDGLVSLGTLGGLLAVGLPYEATPFVLAVGPVVGGLNTRSLVLSPMLRAQQAPEVTRSTTTTTTTTAGAPSVSADLDSAPLSGAHLGEAVHHAR